jgi:hypothetical protein
MEKMKSEQAVLPNPCLKEEEEEKCKNYEAPQHENFSRPKHRPEKTIVIILLDQ